MGMPSITHSSERTPLLRSTSGTHQDDAAIVEHAVTSAEVAEQGEGGPPQMAASDRSNKDDLIKFKKNGKLEGVGEWQFRCAIGGILLGYFVSPIVFTPLEL